MLEDPTHAAFINLMIAILTGWYAVDRIRNDKIVMGVIYMLIHASAFAFFLFRVKEALNP